MPNLDPLTSLPIPTKEDNIGVVSEKQTKPKDPIDRLANFIWSSSEPSIGPGGSQTAPIDYGQWKGIIRRTDSDNEEVRANLQSGWEKFRNAVGQTGVAAVAGALEGIGYMGDLFTDLPERMAGDQMEFENILTRGGARFREWSQDAMPVYQTRRAQRGGIKALGDWSYWMGNMPTIVSSLSIMVPTFMATRALAMTGRALRASRAGTTIAESMSPAIRGIMESRRVHGIMNHAGNTFLSRHVYSSLESRDVSEQIKQQKLMEGYSEEEAKRQAAEGAAYNYRMGWLNIWKDALQWRIILGSRYGSEAATRAVFTSPTNATARRTISELAKTYPQGIPMEAIRRAGIAGQRGWQAVRSVAKMGLLEGFEEINIQHQKGLAMDYVDRLNGAVSGEPIEGWRGMFRATLPGYFRSLGDFMYDPETIISDQAFDAAFWAFMSGATTGAAFKSGQHFMNRPFNKSFPDAVSSEKNKLAFLQSKMASFQMYAAEGDTLKQDQTLNELIFALAFDGLADGTTGFQGALAEARYADLLSSVEQLLTADDTALENNGLPFDSDSRKLYERLFADFKMIEETYQKYMKSKPLTETDSEHRAIANKLTQLEYHQKRWGEMISDYKARAGEIESGQNTQLLKEYKPIADLDLSLKGLEISRSRIKREIGQIKEAVKTTKGDTVEQETKLKEYEGVLQIINSRVQELRAERKQLKEGLPDNSKQYSIIKQYVEDQTELQDLNEFIQTAEVLLESINDQFDTMNTSEGRKEYLSKIKKAKQENLDNHQLALIQESYTVEDLNEVNLEGVSADVRAAFDSRRAFLKKRDRNLEKLRRPDLTEEQITNIQGRAIEVASQDDAIQAIKDFKKQLESEELTDTEKQHAKEYFDEVIGAIYEAQTLEQYRLEQQSLEKSLKKSAPSVFSKLQKAKDGNEARRIINESDVADLVKQNLIQYYIATESLAAEKLNPENVRQFQEDLKEKEVREGKSSPKPPPDRTFNKEDLIIDPEDTSDPFLGVFDDKRTTTVPPGQFVPPSEEASTTPTVKKKKPDVNDPSTLSRSSIPNREILFVAETSSGRIRIMDDGTMFYDNGNPVIGERAQNKALVMKEEAEGTIRKAEYNGHDYAVLSDNKIISLSETNYGKEVYKRGRQREAIMSLIKVIDPNVSDSDFTKFVETGAVSLELIATIGDKIIANEPLSTREAAIYQDKAKDIEAYLQTKRQPESQEETAQKEDTQESEETKQGLSGTLTLAKLDRMVFDPDKIEDGKKKPGLVVRTKYKGDSWVLKDGKPVKKINSILATNPDVQYQETNNPNIKEGDEVEFILEQNDWSKKFPDNRTNQTHPITIVHKDGKEGTKFAFVKASNFKQPEESSLREEIAQKLKNGEKVTGVISKKNFSGAENIMNIKINNMPFFQSIKENELRYIRKEDGSIVKEKQPVVLAISEGVNDDSLLSINSEHYKFLPPSEIQRINDDIAGTKLQEGDNRHDGHVWMVVLSPTGKYKPLKLSTKNLSSEAVNKAVDAILSAENQEALEEAHHIVNTKSTKTEGMDESLYFEASIIFEGAEKGRDSRSRLVIKYFDSNLDTIVEVSRDVRTKDFLVREIEMFDGINEKGFPIPVYSSESQIKSEQEIIDSIKKFLARKKFQVARDRIGDMDTSYTSRITGEEYSNYYEYITSENEVKADPSYPGNTNAIIASDIYNDNGAFFDGVGITIDAQPEITKSETRAQEDAIDPPPETPATKKPPKGRTRVRTAAKSKLVERLENAYIDNAEQFKKVGINSSEDLIQLYRSMEVLPDVDIFVRAKLKEIEC